MSKEIKTIKDLQEQLDTYESNLLLSIVDDENGYSDIEWIKEKGRKQHVLYQWIKLVANHSLNLNTVETFKEKIAQYPEQMIVTLRNREGKYSRLFLVLEELDNQKWVMIVDDLTYQDYYQKNEINWKNKALEKMLEEMKQEHSDTEDCIHTWLCQQQDEKLFQGILKEDRTIKHDEAVNVFNQLKIELEEKAYRERLEKIKKLEQEIDEYMFLVPKKLEEIVEEGKNLNHCVGSYVEKHKTGETTIIFMRKKESQDQSLYTIEYKNKHIVQIQGYKNKEVIPEKVREVANKWVKKIS